MMNDSDERKPQGNPECAGGTENTQRCQSDKRGPFVHCFETSEGKYVFDANTMCIVPVDEIVWEIVPNVGVVTQEGLAARYAGRFTADEIGAAYERVLAQQREGYFLSRWPRVEFTLSEEQVREALRSKREILILNVTERCNFRCKYCSYDGRHEGRPAHSSKEMAWPVAKQAIDEFLPYTIKTPSITFYGGEPLLNIDLIKECVAYAHRTVGDRKVNFGMTTNGWLLTEDVADYLVAEDFSLSISVDGPQEMHDRYRRTVEDRPTWSRVAQNLRAFLDRHPKYTSHMLLAVTLVPPLDVEAVDAFFQTTDLLRRGMSLQVNVADLHGAQEDMFGDLTIRNYHALRHRFLEDLAGGYINGRTQDRRHTFARRLFEKDLLHFRKRFQMGESVHARRHFADVYCALSNCIPGGRRTFVGTEGAYWPCERVPQSEYMRIGQVGQGLDVPKIHRLLQEWVDMSKNQCQTCWCLRGCNVGCMASINNGDRPTPELKQRSCQSHRQEHHELLTDYCRVLEKNPTNLDYMDSIIVS
jgi:uncharacterized protein